MKQAGCFLLFFLFLGLYSGAMSITTIVIFIVLSGGILYLAWLEEKKEKQRKIELINTRKERLSRLT